VIHEHSQWLDRLIYACAGVSGVFFALSFWQAVALGVAIISGLISASLGIMRWHDRLKYGPKP
jgi:hypothetical protein